MTTWLVHKIEANLGQVSSDVGFVGQRALTDAAYWRCVSGSPMHIHLAPIGLIGNEF